METEATLIVFGYYPCRNRRRPVMVLDQHVRCPRLAALAPGGREDPVCSLRVGRYRPPCLHRLRQQRMQWHRCLRSLAFGYSDCSTRPSPADVNLRVFKADILPLQAQTFRDAKPGAGGEGEGGLGKATGTPTCRAEPASAVISDYRLAPSSATGLLMISVRTLPTEPLGVSIPRMLASVGAKSFSATF